MTCAYSHFVWISLWLVAIAILVAGVGMVVAPWHGNYAKHIPASWKDCSTVVGDPGDCLEGCVIPSVSLYQR